VAQASAADLVYGRVLAAIQDGGLTPGERLIDLELAAELGVSRAPVRDALQRLRMVGVVETVAGHYTRVAVIDPVRTEQAFRVRLELFRAVVNEVVPTISAGTVSQMRAAHRSFRAHMRPFDAYELAAADATFYATLADSANTELTRAVQSVTHVVRLGGMGIAERVDVRGLYKVQTAMLAAVRARDPGAGQAALDMMGALTLRD
jgi:DNA-binding GntR family transcriptional regulator